jgi:3,4-dihydroxy 2-butanone 4-phosphate synthase/GTP cyclohydrolase II
MHHVSPPAPIANLDNDLDNQCGKGGASAPSVRPDVIRADEFAEVRTAAAALAAGRPIVVVDDEDRENEGDLILGAEFATPALVAFFVRHTSGLLCAGMEAPTLDRLGLPPMVPDENNADPRGTAFTVSVDLARGISTGISAADRAATVRALADPSSQAEDFTRPGHVFPLRARPGGVLKRAGHTEAAVDLTRMAGVSPVGLLCELANDDGTMTKGTQLLAFATRHKLPLVSIADLVRHRFREEPLVRLLSSARLPTNWGTFTVHVFESILDGVQHLAIVKGNLETESAPVVRVHSECLTGDILGSVRCDCGAQLQQALARIEQEGAGALVYLRGHEGRGIGLAHKIRAYALQDQGQDTVDANLSLGLPVDSREYGIGAQILVQLGVRRMRLMTNNPRKYRGLSGFGLEIVDRVPLIVGRHAENVAYLEVKRRRLGHLLDAVISDEPTLCEGNHEGR